MRRSAGKRNSANDMFKSLIDGGVIVVQQGGTTKTAHLLYLKGKAAEPQLDACSESIITCSRTCANFVTRQARFRHARGVSPEFHLTSEPSYRGGPMNEIDTNIHNLKML